jgi:nucleoside-diphosphate-sugar epimerase
MRIFISEVAGFLGSHLAESFLADGHEVVGCDNMLGGELDNVPAGVNCYQHDCCQHNSMVKMKDRLQSMIHHIRRKGPRPYRYHLDLEIVNELTPRTWKEKLF